MTDSANKGGTLGVKVDMISSKFNPVERDQIWREILKDEKKLKRDVTEFSQEKFKQTRGKEEYPLLSSQEYGLDWEEGKEGFEREVPWRQPISTTKISQYASDYYYLFHTSPFSNVNK